MFLGISDTGKGVVFVAWAWVEVGLFVGQREASHVPGLQNPRSLHRMGKSKVFFALTRRFRLRVIRTERVYSSYSEGELVMALISFALLEAREAGVPVSVMADRLQLSEAWIAERIEAARLCLIVAESLG